MEVDDESIFVQPEKKTVDIEKKRAVLAYVKNLFEVVHNTLVNGTHTVAAVIKLDRSGIEAGVMSTIFTHMMKPLS